MRTWKDFTKQDVNKSRFWEGILYPENMTNKWERDISDILQLPFAYCIHNMDNCLDDSDRKVHVHLIIAWSGPTTKKNALSTMNMLSEDGRKCCPAVSACVSIRRCYDYLIHDTDQAREDGKYQYTPERRVEGNNFDIGAYETVSTADKMQYLFMMEDLIYDEGICNYYDLNNEIRKRYGSQFRQLFLTYSGHFYRIIQEKRFRDKEEQKKKEYEEFLKNKEEMTKKWERFQKFVNDHDITPE